MGKTLTFEEMRGFWPAQSDDRTGVSAYLNSVQKYVVSSTLQDAQWEPTTILRGLDDVRRLKESAGGSLVVFGGVQTVRSLVAADVVDEYWLKLNPAAVGRGGSMFSDLTKAKSLTLRSARSYPSGTVALVYSI